MKNGRVRRGRQVKLNTNEGGMDLEATPSTQQPSNQHLNRAGNNKLKNSQHKNQMDLAIAKTRSQTELSREAAAHGKKSQRNLPLIIGESE